MSTLHKLQKHVFEMAGHSFECALNRLIFPLVQYCNKLPNFLQTYEHQMELANFFTMPS